MEAGGVVTVYFFYQEAFVEVYWVHTKDRPWRLAHSYVYYIENSPPIISNDFQTRDSLSDTCKKLHTLLNDACMMALTVELF